MPIMNGLEAAPLLVKILPRVWLILLTLYEQPEVHRRAKIAGIQGVVSKAKASTHLIRSLLRRLYAKIKLKRNRMVSAKALRFQFLWPDPESGFFYFRSSAFAFWRRLFSWPRSSPSSFPDPPRCAWPAQSSSYAHRAGLRLS